MNCLGLVDQSDSELELYLRKVLKSTGVDVTSLSGNATSGELTTINGSSPGRASNGVALRASNRDVSSTVT